MFENILGQTHQIQRSITERLPLKFKKWLLHQDLTWRVRYMPALLDRYLWRRTPIIIYQMGKVGSSSIYHSLANAGLFTLHAHYLNPVLLEQQIQQEIKHYPIQKKHWLWIYNQFIRKKCPVKFITIVRDPIALVISWYFQSRVDRFSKTSNDIPIADIQAGFDAECDTVLTEKLNWFDKELAVSLGIDVYAYPFDKQKGYAIIRDGNFELLIFRLEVADAVKEQVIAEFMGLTAFRLIPANVGESRVFADLYRQFKKEAIFADETLNLAYTSKMMHHFYTDIEIAAFRARWSRT